MTRFGKACRITRSVLLPMAALIGAAALSGCYIYPDRPYGGGYSYGGGGYGYGGGGYGYGYHAPYYYR